jgi:hypothetical protein
MNQRKIVQSQGILSGSCSLRSDGSRDIRMGGWTTISGGQKVLKTKPDQGGLSGLNPLRSDGSHDGQAGGWTMLTVAKGTQMESWKTTLGSQET